MRLADHLVETFGEDRRHDVDGHPVVEMALVEMYRETGKRTYLDLAATSWTLAVTACMQGHGHEPTYFSDRVPVREQTTVEGHAVRAVYLAAGAADVATESGDGELLLEALQRQFAHMLATKTYITGGLGSRWDGEAFGDPYELPPDRAYAETCAAIGGVQWAWRMLLATGEMFYADVAERMLFNGFLAGVSLSGSEYFYVNTLHLRADAHADNDRSPANGRRGWYEVACCPPNIMRTLASLEGLRRDHRRRWPPDSPVRAGDHRREGGRCAGVGVGGDGLPLGRQDPRTGRRDPARRSGPSRCECRRGPRGRASAWTTSEQPVDAGRLASVRRRWRAGDVVELTLPMDVRLVEADERVDAVRGCVAIERGPLVYAIEAIDQAEGVVVDDLDLDLGGRPARSTGPISSAA